MIAFATAAQIFIGALGWLALSIVVALVLGSAIRGSSLIVPPPGTGRGWPGPLGLPPGRASTGPPSPLHPPTTTARGL